MAAARTIAPGDAYRQRSASYPLGLPPCGSEAIELENSLFLHLPLFGLDGNRCPAQSGYPLMLIACLGQSGRRLVAYCLVLAATTLVGGHPGAVLADGERDSILRPEVRPIRERIAPLIDAAQERFQVPGISLALVRGGEVLWAEGFGHADRERGIAATPQTIYRTGSLAKPLTAVAAMQLAEAGEIGLDEPLQAYLPEFFIRSRFGSARDPITVRSVLCHHSGLPTDLNKGMWTETPFTQVARQLHQEYTAFPPNLVFSYSNIGFTLLGHMIEKVSGQAYADYLSQRLFVPAGMMQSSVAGRPQARGQLARGYRDGRPFKRLPIRDAPALGLDTSAADLGRLMSALLSDGQIDGRRLIGSATLRETFTPQNLDVALDLDIINGLGWFIEDGTIPGGGPVVRHGGTTLAFASEMVLLPAHRLGVVVLANADGSRPIVSQLAEGILKSVLKVMPEPTTAHRFLADLERRRTKAEPAEIAGSYATDFGLISIQRQDPKLCACLLEETFDLIPHPDGWYGLGGAALSTLPGAFRPLAAMRLQTQIIDGREVVVAKQGETRILMGEKVPEGPVPEAWLKRVGRYRILNPDPGFPLTRPRLKVREGHLCLSYQMPALSANTIQVPLHAISDTEAIILGLGRTRGETLSIVRVNGEERLRYSGFIGRRVGS